MSEETKELVINRVKTRLKGESVEDSLLEELTQTANDRLCILLGEESIPITFESICVDAVVKMYRRLYFEGITTDSAANISTSFVSDVLAEYAGEIAVYVSDKKNKREVVFL